MPTFEDRLKWLPWGAGVMAGTLTLPFLWPFPAARSAALFLVGIALAGGALTILRGFVKPRYDLGELQREIEKDEVRQLLEEECAANPEKVLCTCCGEEYDAKFSMCPYCQKH